MANNAIDFNTTAGQTIARELMIAYLNTGTSAEPVWSPLGRRVEDSSIEFDWSTDTKQDILGSTWTTGKKATRTQSFEPWELDSGDAAQKLIYNLAVVEDNVQALLSQDCLIVHFYTKDSLNKIFAERYSSCAVLPTSLGGEGGGSNAMPIDVTYGGTRTKGTATISNGVVTFTADATVGG